MNLDVTDELIGARRSARGVVLYVENHDDSRITIGKLLRAAGFDFHEAATGEAALRQADSLRNTLDVLIVDFNLGGEINGAQVAESLAGLLGHAVPTIILTGDPANAEVPLLRNCPVWVASKPICTLSLVAGLHPFVAFRRAMKRIAVGEIRTRS